MIEASVGMGDLEMAFIICGSILLIALMILWTCLRMDNKVGPLAAAEQAHEIEKFRTQSILLAKKAEADLAIADAKVIEARKNAVEVANRQLNEASSDETRLRAY